MSKALEIWNTLSTRIVRGGRRPREPIPISGGAPPRPPIKPHEDYFGLRINQLFLRDARQWFTTIDPAVYATTEFLYGGVMRTDPFIIGPKKDGMLPPGMVLQNTSVCGPHPYRGGKLGYTLVLAQVPVDNLARGLLDLVEATGNVLDPSASVAMWTKVSGVVLDGFDRLMGLDGTQPLMGFRLQHDADAGDQLHPGHFALIDADAPDPAEFWVKNHRLLHGSTRETAKPFLDSDYLLYEITSPADSRRTDVSRLPFHPLWQHAFETAGKPGPDAWDEAKSNMAALASALFRSPDLTRDQAQFLRAEYVAMLKAEHQKAKELERLGHGRQDEGPTIAVGDILKLD